MMSTDGRGFHAGVRGKASYTFVPTAALLHSCLEHSLSWPNSAAQLSGAFVELAKLGMQKDAT